MLTVASLVPLLAEVSTLVALHPRALRRVLLLVPDQPLRLLNHQVVHLRHLHQPLLRVLQVHLHLEVQRLPQVLPHPAALVLLHQVDLVLPHRVALALLHLIVLVDHQVVLHRQPHLLAQLHRLVLRHPEVLLDLHLVPQVALLPDLLLEVLLAAHLDLLPSLLLEAHRSLPVILQVRRLVKHQVEVSTLVPLRLRVHL